MPGKGIDDPPTHPGQPAIDGIGWGPGGQQVADELVGVDVGHAQVRPQPATSATQDFPTALGP